MFCLVATLCASLIWASLFTVFSLCIRLPIPRKRMWDLRNRLVSFVHGLFCIWFAVSDLMGGMMLGASNSEFHELVLCGSLGYFVYDTVCMLIFGICDRMIILHHCLVISAVVSCVYSGSGGTEAMMGYFVSEFTNPLLHFKEILKLLNQKTTQIYFIAELSFFLGYFFSRYAVGIPAIYLIVTSKEVILSERIAGLGLEIMFLYWGRTMWGILHKRIGERRERIRSGVVLPWTVGIAYKEE